MPLVLRRSLPYAFAALLLGAAGALLSTQLQAQRGEATPRAVTPRGALHADEQATVDLFKRLSPSVVHITTLQVQRDFFNRAVGQVPSGTGTGFVWDGNGHIVTNFHVIQGGSGATVTLADQSTFKAQLVGAFPDRDLAVLKIDAPKDKLPAIPVGTSRDLQVGQKVFAIGNPFGLDQTLTTGIVSALNREIESFNNRSIRGVVQTDAAINPGNSGGPLLDSAGRLIGVNTQIASPSGASAGIGFAIPVDEVNRIVPRLIRDGKISRPTLGISAASEQIQRALRLPDGVALVQVAPGGPAAKAGLQAFSRARDGSIVAGDIIVAINDEPVASLDDMLTLLEKRQPGDAVTLAVSRNGRGRKVQVHLGQGD
ncbi:MAG: trypsin-like peptidase domain-containing protein [Pseudacidovorax sp.]|uniref:S1C family serine protease n=1 Tax=Pseudacidovorax sp. TaxID=1934311 RepID=UPI001B714FA8|nr:trypsin-like peptidase domain-containing protein [Pseudacidovorax sp.]MBP6898335.1 trypsin-like peptidase domain-containing protein [Pseudacidovorax sp.]MBP6901070.1 trypsin-like peptidase domain-containing protein [Burkholderiaceae bacterium]